jgi:outer membrane lipoprotein SlyB
MRNPCIILGSLALICAGCETKTQSGALGGAGVGALAGGLMGGGTGALIGGAVGAAGGAAIGASLDAQDRKNMEKNAPQTLRKIDNQQQLTPYDIQEMVKNGLSDEIVIDQIKATKSVFYLTSTQIIELKNAGVSERIISYMIQTGTE